MASNAHTSINGWTAVPLDPSRIFTQGLKEPKSLLVADIEFPNNDLVTHVRRFAETHLPEPTLSHSMRVFYFATAIARSQFPEQAADLSPTTLAITALLHDIGTAKENLSATRMSFEFYGAIKVHNLLSHLGCEQDQADAVCETIIRHQDLGVEGNITLLGQIIQLATIYDNVGEHPSLSHIDKIIQVDTLNDVNKQFPRHKWLSCFADTIREEERLKPWCHSTSIPDFDRKIEANELMKPYEQ